MKFPVLTRLTALNLLGFALMALFAWNGQFSTILATDITYITSIISGFFLFALCLVYWRGWQIDTRHLPDHHTQKESQIQARLANRLVWIKSIAYGCVLLGLIGTVIGFIVAFSSVPVDQTFNVEMLSRIMPELINGMGIALYTTLAGAISSLWLHFNLTILTQGLGKLYVEKMNV